MKRRLDHLVLAHECDAVPPALRQRYTWPYYGGKVATLVDPQKPDKPLFLKRTKMVFEVEALRIFGSTPMPADQVLFVPKLRRVTTQLNELNFSTQVEELASEKIGSHLRNDKTWWMLMENPFPARCVFTLSLKAQAATINSDPYAIWQLGDAPYGHDALDGAREFPIIFDFTNPRQCQRADDYFKRKIGFPLFTGQPISSVT